MSIENSLERIANALEVLLAEKGKVPEIQLDAPEKKKPGRLAKAAATTEEVDPLATEPTPPKVISVEELRTALQGFMAKNGMDKTKALMIKYGANAAKPIITTIPASNYAALVAEIEA